MKQVRRTLLSVIMSLIFLFGVIGVTGCSKKVKITFETFGGTKIASIKEAPGTEITPPADPERYGYLFDGWYLDEGCTGEKVELPTVMPDTNTTYYAKWVEAEMAELTLDAGEGGTLTTADKFTIAVGTNLSNFLANKTPTVNSGLEFAGWYNWATPIDENSVMTSGGLTLTAKYWASYTYNIYNMDVEGHYPTTASKTGTDKAIYKERLDFNNKEIPTGFKVDGTQNGSKVVSEALDLNETFNVYYARETYAVTYNGNTPAGMTVTGTIEQQNVLYEAQITTATEGFIIDNDSEYRLGGWATSGNGDVVYQLGESFSVTGNVTLYAYWSRALIDQFGGNDRIFVIGDKAYLLRGEEEYEGTYNKDTKEFSFRDGALKGVAYNNQSFAYVNDAVAGVYTGYYGFIDPVALNDETNPRIIQGYEITGCSLQIDNVGKAIYTLNDQTITGLIQLDPENTTSTLNYYTFKADDGSLEFGFYLTTAGESRLPIFMMQAGDIGLYNMYNPSTGSIYYQSVYLTGYGVAYLVNGQTGQISTIGFYLPYSETAPIYRIFWLSSDGTALTGEDVIALVQLSSYSCYIAQDSQYVGSFVNTRGDETLELDGFGINSDSAKYTDKDGTVYEGIYQLYESQTKGTMLDLYYQNDQGEEAVITFLLSVVGEQKLFSIDERVDDRYLLIGGSVTDPILIVYTNSTDTDPSWPDGAFKAELYSANQDGTTEMLLSEGYVYLTDEAHYIYAYKGTASITAEDNPDEYEIYEDFLSQMTFLLSTHTIQGILTSTTYNVYIVLEAGENQLYTEFTEKAEGDSEGKGKLYASTSGSSIAGSFFVTEVNGQQVVLNGGVAYYYYDKDNPQTASSVKFTQFIIRFGYRVQTASGYAMSYIYLEVDGVQVSEDGAITWPEDPKFRMLNTAPMAMYFSDTFGTAESNLTLFLDGYDKAVYIKDGQEYTGTYSAETDETYGYDVFTFTPDRGQQVESFEFLILIRQATFTTVTVYVKKDATYVGEFTSTGSATLELDGYGYSAIYTDEDGNVINGQYTLTQEDDKVYLTFINSETGGYMIMDLNTTSGKTFTIRGIENLIGAMQIVDNQVGLNAIIFDGYNKFSIYTIDEDGYLSEEAIANGTYTVNEDGAYELTYSGKDTPVIADIMVRSSSSGNTYLLVVRHEEIANTYVAEDWTMLQVDEHGNAYYFDEVGKLHAGVVQKITEDVILFESTDIEELVKLDADADNGPTFEFLDYSQYMGVYYANDLSAIGLDMVAYIKGNDGCYYLVNDDGTEITLYNFSEEEGKFVADVDKMTLADGVITYKNIQYTKFTGKQMYISGKYHNGIYNLSDYGITGVLDGMFVFTPTANTMNQVEGYFALDAGNLPGIFVTEYDEDGNPTFLFYDYFETYHDITLSGINLANNTANYHITKDYVVNQYTDSMYSSSMGLMNGVMILLIEQAFDNSDIKQGDVKYSIIARVSYRSLNERGQYLVNTFIFDDYVEAEYSSAQISGQNVGIYSVEYQPEGYTGTFYISYFMYNNGTFGYYQIIYTNEFTDETNKVKVVTTQFVDSYLQWQSNNVPLAQGDMIAFGIYPTEGATEEPLEIKYAVMSDNGASYWCEIDDKEAEQRYGYGIRFELDEHGLNSNVTVTKYNAYDVKLTLPDLLTEDEEFTLTVLADEENNVQVIVHIDVPDSAQNYGFASRGDDETENVWYLLIQTSESEVVEYKITFTYGEENQFTAQAEKVEDVEEEEEGPGAGFLQAELAA